MAIAAGTAACGGSASSGDSPVPGRDFGGGPQTTATGSAPIAPGANAGIPVLGAAGSGSVADLPPEVEMSVDLQLPQASENYVYAVNPDAGTVAVIDAKTQAIQTIKTGTRPTYLRTLPTTDNAIVINVGSNKASLIRVTAQGATKSDLSVGSGANAIAVAPDGKHVVVYFNSSYASVGNGSGSYQDVSVLQLSADGKSDKATSMTVGFRPRDVFFSDDGKNAFVVTEDGVSVLDFAQVDKQGSSIAKLVSFGGSVDQKNSDVAVTPDGLFALARAEGKSVLHLVELATGLVRSLDLAKAYTPPPPDGDDAGVPVALPVQVTDLDLMPGGHAALAVLRNQSAVLTVPLPAAFDDATQVKTLNVEGEVIGSTTVAPDGKSALAYTTAANVERITILDLTSDKALPHTVALRKAVLAVSYTPDSKTALITHTKLIGSPAERGLSPDAVIDRSYGYSLLRVPSGDVKLQVTQTGLGPIAMVPDGSYLFILFRNDTAAIKEVQRVALASFLVDPIIQLENPPISMGVAPASGTVFVNLEHPDGRMTFIDWNEPLTKLKTVTGFELNSRIRD
jgi:YVTN family beta-propeller protein